MIKVLSNFLSAINLYKKPEDYFYEEETQKLVKEFLDLWAKSHEATTIQQINEYEMKAFGIWEKVEETFPKEHILSPGFYFRMVDWKSTGYPAPRGGVIRWNFEVFSSQREKLQSIEEKQKDRYRKLMKTQSSMGAT